MGSPGFRISNLTALFISMQKPTANTHLGDAWRDHILNEVVAFLDKNRDAIIERFETEQAGGLSKKELVNQGLLDFDVAITLHRDRKDDFGLGSGFFKANLIR